IKHCSSNPGGLKKKKRVRSFFWKTIPAEQVKGHANLWTQGPVQQDFQIDVQKIEELFTQSDGPPVSMLTRGGKTRVSFREAKDEVSILDSKRGLNIAIFLKQFKRSNQTLVDEIHHGNSESFGAEPLRELLKLLPDKDEVNISSDVPETQTSSPTERNTNILFNHKRRFCRKRRGLQAVLPPVACRHQVQQTGHEPAALRGSGQ
uniref:FH2 domain-containing protein n=1 Tax=Poecilia latipinna TaxID=48699 RepID=A0A3B3U0H3_9TELE